MVCYIIWRGRYYDFRRIVERLVAIEMLFRKTRHMNLLEKKTPLEELQNSVLRNEPPSSQLHGLVHSITYEDADGDAAVNPLVVKAALDPSSFHLALTSMDVVVYDNGRIMLRRIDNWDKGVSHGQ